MKKYKNILLQGFKQRRFDLVQQFDNDDNIPWWIEEKWILNGLKSDFRCENLVISFLTHREWESGPKLVDDISVTTKEMKSYSDAENELAALQQKMASEYELPPYDFIG